MAGLMIARIVIRDKSELDEYLANVKGVASKHGAEVMFLGEIKRVLNGAPDAHDMLVIVRFPSADAASAWFDDPEYQPLVETREAGGKMEMIAYEPLAA